MSVSFLLFTVEQRLKSLSLYSLQKMALKAEITEEEINEKHISTLRVMLLYRYFLGILPVIWKKLSPDVMRSIIPFLITDIYVTRRGRVFLKNMIKKLEFRKFFIRQTEGYDSTIYTYSLCNLFIKKIKKALTFDDRSLDLFVISEKQKKFDKKESIKSQNSYRTQIIDQIPDPDEQFFLIKNEREQATLEKKKANKKGLYKLWKTQLKLATTGFGKKPVTYQDLLIHIHL